MKPEERIGNLEFALEKTQRAISANKNPDFDIHQISAPLQNHEIEWRVQRSGLKNGKPWALIIPYIDARAVMKRLDGVCSPEFWQDHYEITESGVICTIMIKINGEWISKQDGAGFEEKGDIDRLKSAISNSFKRTAVKWGMGRELYDMTETFAVIVEKKTNHSRYAKGKDKSTGQEFSFWWEVPQ